MDGKITKAEAPEQMQAGFSGMDGNSDGGITLEEWKQAISKRGGAR